MKSKLWEEVSLGSVCEVLPGFAFKSKELGTDGIPVVKIGDIKDDLTIDLENCSRIPDDVVDEKMKKYSLVDKDILLAMTGATAGKIGRLRNSEPALLNQRVAKIKAQKINDDFVWFVLSTPLYRETFYNLGRGAAQPNISGGQIESVIIPLPALPIQQRIASILSAYDDLIENNLRRIKLLEESARQLFKEWFVRLRFPGYEHTKIIKGVPEGWEKKSLSEISKSINYGYTESAQIEEVGPKFLRITDIVPNFIDWSTVPHCPISDDKKEKLLLQEGDIVVARTGATVGYAKRLHRRHPEAVFASYLVRFRLSSEVSNIMVGTFVESEDYKAYVKSRVGGAAQPNANAKVLGDVRILVPTKQLQREFDEIISKLLDQKEVLQIQNQKLKQARDILLPKLMSSEVEV